jgi:sugar transferase EpsL
MAASLHSASLFALLFALQTETRSFEAVAGGFSLYRRYGKRIFDLLLTLVILLPALLVMAILGLAVRLKLGAPVLFRQVRPGLGGAGFTLLKFRSMNDNRGEDGSLLPDDSRMTSFGKFLRKTSLDELPELVNVLRGEMSLVGPRPLLMRYLTRYSREQARRHHVSPGITGWAQIRGRNTLDWEDSLAMDVWYVDHHSFCLDLKILALTVWRVIKSEGITEPGSETRSEFRGREP